MTTEPLDQELPRRARRRLVTPVVIVAGALTIAALGFLGGVEVQKARTDATPAAGFPGAAARAGAGGGQPQQQQGDATVGEVASVDGKTIYVDDASGTTLRVRLGKGGKVTRTAVADVDEIHPGDTVIVQGETSSSGTLVASSIRATASNAGGGPMGGFTAPRRGG